MKELSTPNLKKKAIRIFHEYIRKRDEGQPCISCGNKRELQAGHFHSAGKHERLRFNSDNVNGQCKVCNYFLSGNLLNYRKNLIKKIGEDRVNKLDMIASNRKPFKSDRFFYEQVIKEYSYKLKQKP